MPRLKLLLGPHHEIKTVIDVYFYNVKLYYEMNEAKPRKMSRSAFERGLLGGLRQCKLDLESYMALTHAILEGGNFNRWWTMTQQNLSLKDAQIERYVSDPTLCYIPLSSAIVWDSDDSDDAESDGAESDETDSGGSERDGAGSGGNESDGAGSDGAGSSTLSRDQHTIRGGQDLDSNALGPDLGDYEQVRRPRSRRPLKDYGPEILKIEKKQAKEDGAYNPNNSSQAKKVKKSGRRPLGGPSTNRGRSKDAVSCSLAQFDAEHQPEAKAQATDGEDEVMADT